ncbi:MAG: OmpA family protein, partial [Acidimicrobiales bacterium]
IALDELADATELTGVLEYHLVEGTVTTRDLATVTALPSVQGESIPVEALADGSFRVGDALILTEDIDATNGVVHVVDAVLLPGTLRTEVALNALVTLDPILFARGSDQILEDSFEILDQAVAILKDNRAGRVEIQGHTDSDGPAEVNLDLSQRRADSVKVYMVEQGIRGARLNATGYGETQLKIDPEESDEDRAANRRIEFRVN